MAAEAPLASERRDFAAGSASKSAPRFPAPRGSMAKAIKEEERRRDAVAALGSYSFDYTTPLPDGTADDVRTVLEEAHSLTIVVSHALDADPSNDEATGHLRPVHVGQAIGAIGRLIALAAFSLDAQP